MIDVKNLQKTYTTYERGSNFKDAVKSLFVRKMKTVHALDNISFHIEEGELVGFLGPNGAGKSTTLKILTGILFPTEGEVKVLGYVPWKQRKKYVSNIGAVFGQKSQLFWDIPPMDAFLLSKAVYDIPEKQFKATLNKMIEILNVSEFVRKPTRQLSLGERMKCEFIAAMLHKPKVVFLDEPTIGLDVMSKEKIRQFILESNKEGTTFVLTTHDLGDVEFLAKRVIVVNHGRIAFDNSLEGLKNYVGTKKIIRLSTQKPFVNVMNNGVSVVSQVSEHEAELELDLSKINLNEFIGCVSNTNVIIDMTVADPPIEESIKELYLQTGQ